MKKNKSPKLTLIIPAYREETLIDSSLREVHSFLDLKDMLSTTEIIVVAADGGDKTAEIAQSHAKNFENFRVLTPGARVGKGRDVALGMLEAKGEFRIFTDADLATPLRHMEPMLARLETDADVVIGVREVGKVHHTMARRVSSRLSNLLIQLMAVPGISDTQCGFKGFRADSAEALFSQVTIKGWGFDFEVLAIAKKRKLVIAQLEINDWADPKGDHGLVGDSQWGAMEKTFRELIRVRRNIWRGVYK